MSKLLELIKALLPEVQPRHVLDEAYLAESADRYGLERRMREIDQRCRALRFEPLVAGGVQ